MVIIRQHPHALVLHFFWSVAEDLIMNERS
jgi:hypothetical protein